MRKTNLIIFSTLLFWALSAQNGWSQTDQSSYSFSLQEAIEFALKNSQSVKNAELEKEIASSQVGEILADGLPQITGNLDLGYNYKIQQSFVPANLFDPINGDPNELVPAQFGADYTGSASLGLDQMIFDGAYFIGLKAARIFTELSTKDHLKSQIDVIEAVSKAYYLVLINREREKLVESNFNRIDSLLSDTQLLFENGFREKIDVSRVKVQHNNLKVEARNISEMVALSVSVMKFQMGMSPKASVELTDNISALEFNPLVEDVKGNFTYDQRIEYSRLMTQKELNELDIRNVNSGYIPKLNLYGSLGINTGTNQVGDWLSVGGDKWLGNGVVGVRMSMPIFDGFRKRNQVQQRKLKARQIDYSFMQLKNNIDVEIERGTVNYNKSSDNIVAQRENMELASEVYRVSKIKYEEGVGSNYEVLDANTSLKESQTNYYNALYDAFIAKIELEKALGTLMK